MHDFTVRVKLKCPQNFLTRALIAYNLEFHDIVSKATSMKQIFRVDRPMDGLHHK